MADLNFSNIENKLLNTELPNYIQGGINNALRNVGGFDLSVMGKDSHPLLSDETLAANRDTTIVLHVYDFEGTTQDAIRSSKEFTDNGASWIHYFRNTPDEQTDTTPMRSTFTLTAGGIWLDDFGPGVREISIKGNTGYRKLTAPGDSQVLDGRQMFNRLSGIIKGYIAEREFRRARGRNPKNLVMVMRVFNDKDLDVVVHPTNFSFFRSKQNPLLYMYDLKFTVLGSWKELVPKATKDTVLDRLHDRGLMETSLFDSALTELGVTLIKGYFAGKINDVNFQKNIVQSMIDNILPFYLAGVFNVREGIEAGADYVNKSIKAATDANLLAQLGEEQSAYDLSGYAQINAEKMSEATAKKKATADSLQASIIRESLKRGLSDINKKTGQSTTLQQSVVEDITSIPRTIEPASKPVPAALNINDYPYKTLNDMNMLDVSSKASDNTLAISALNAESFANRNNPYYTTQDNLKSVADSIVWGNRSSEQAAYYLTKSNRGIFFPATAEGGLESRYLP